MPIIAVPEVVQWGSTANLTRDDCGVACTAMLLDFYGKLNGLTVDQLARETSLVQADVGLATYQLALLARKHGLTLDMHDHTTLDEIRAEIDAGRPVICLIAYRFLLSRMDQGDSQPFSDGHYIVVCGYDDTHFVINDPDYSPVYASRGHHTFIPVTELDKALAGNNYGNQCLFVEVPLLADQITALAKQIEALAAQITPPVVPPPPPPDPIPNPTQAVVTTDGLQVRVKASTAFASLGSLHKGDVLTVIDASAEPGDTHTWCKITGATVSTFIGAYCAKNYLSFL